jgi:hypothetical protein
MKYELYATKSIPIETSFEHEFNDILFVAYNTFVGQIEDLNTCLIHSEGGTSSRFHAKKRHYVFAKEIQQA